MAVTLHADTFGTHESFRTWMIIYRVVINKEICTCGGARKPRRRASTVALFGAAMEAGANNGHRERSVVNCPQGFVATNSSSYRWGLCGSSRV